PVPWPPGTRGPHLHRLRFRLTPTPPPDRHPLSLHDALPISAAAPKTGLPWWIYGGAMQAAVWDVFFSADPMKEIITLEKFVITGGRPLMGEVDISGAKNAAVGILPATILDRKSTRLNSSHVSISYA